MVLTRWLLPALVWALASSAAANSALEEQLAEAFKPFQGEAATPQRSKGGWHGGDNGSRAGQSCAMTYVDGDLALGYIGPSKDWEYSYFFVSGPDVPIAAKAKEVGATLATGLDRPQQVKAIHHPVQGRRSAVLFQLTDIQAALAAMQDSEAVAVSIEGAAVFNARWQGGFAARDRMRECLAATPPSR
jgi:hypothetical protein